MGYMADGEWHTGDMGAKARNGAFKRAETRFRNWITADGSPGPTGEGGFKAEPGRYHLYVSWACPWAHRTLIMRKFKGLEDAISVSATHWHMDENGWTFEPDEDVIPDTVNGADYLHQVYARADSHYSGRVTVPVLWDRERQTIVSNESAEIIRMFNRAFDAPASNAPDYYPEELRSEIDAINEEVYANVNNGVYRCGFARTQEAYEEAFGDLFSTLDRLEQRLADRRFLCGSRLTEADIRLFTTLVRFDAVYFGHFKCNLRMLKDYPALSGYLRDIHQQPGVAGTVNLRHIKNHYYGSHESINPLGIVPVGPELDFAAPHGRERLG